MLPQVEHSMELEGVGGPLPVDVNRTVGCTVAKPYWCVKDFKYKGPRSGQVSFNRRTVVFVFMDICQVVGVKKGGQRFVSCTTKFKT